VPYTTKALRETFFEGTLHRSVLIGDHHEINAMRSTKINLFCISAHLTLKVSLRGMEPRSVPEVLCPLVLKG
jgi:hypothetical protein